MAFLTTPRRLFVALAVAAVVASAVHAESADGLRKRLAAATASIQDLKGTIVMTPASRSNASEINKGVLQFLDNGFRDANFWFKKPDRYRIQGKAKGVDVTYVLSGDRKQVLVPALMLKQTEDLSESISKKQSTLDMGFASDLIWNDATVKILAQKKGVAELSIVYRGDRTKRHDLVWIDTKSLKVLRRERYGKNGNLKGRYVFGNHRMLNGIPVAMIIKAYAPDGGYAGSFSVKNLELNSGLPNTLFVIK